MFITSCLQTFGEYALFMRRVLTRPDRLKESLKRYVFEISKLGIDSIPLVIVISLFIGAVIAIQMCAHAGGTGVVPDLFSFRKHSAYEGEMFRTVKITMAPENPFVCPWREFFHIRRWHDMCPESKEEPYCGNSFSGFFMCENHFIE